MKNDKLYLWQDESKIKVIPMLDQDVNSHISPNQGYNPEINAQIVAKMFGEMLPSNTTDIIYHAIAKRMIEILQEGYRYKHDENEIACHVQSAINSLLDEKGC